MCLITIYLIYLNDGFWVSVYDADKLDGVSLGCMDENFLHFNLGFELHADFNLLFDLKIENKCVTAWFGRILTGIGFRRSIC